MNENTNTISYKQIVESVDKHSCPGMFWCTVATTCYEESKRRAICLDCWLKTMKEREIKVIYEGEYESEMSAQEMFEKLGYTCVKTNSEVIAYRYYTEDKSSYIREIDFLLDVEKYCTFEYLCGLFIGAELHKAITKQMEELGWLEK